MNEKDSSDDFLKAVVAESRHPHNCRVMDRPTHQAHGYNRVCGDAVTVYVTVREDRIVDAAFSGDCCAVCKCSASKLTVHALNKTAAEFAALLTTFDQLLHGKLNHEHEQAALGDLSVFAGIREYPARIPCATLAWQTLRAALAREPETSTE